MAEGNEFSILHINKAQIDLDASVDQYSQQVYDLARDNLKKFIDEGHMQRDEMECLYIYKQHMAGLHPQYGVMGVVPTEQYNAGLIKRHEKTRKAKEDDRTKTVNIQNANVGPVFLTYPPQERINELVSRITSEKADYDFKATYEPVQHTLWKVKDAGMQKALISAFDELVPAAYVADGHHRAASAARVGDIRRKKAEAEGKVVTGEECFNYFLAVIFPGDQLNVLDYNRVVKDLNGLKPAEFITKVEEHFAVEKVKDHVEAKNLSKNVFSMYIEKQWYKLTLKANEQPEDIVDKLDVSILTHTVLEPILAIGDLRTDSRIDFVGGIRGYPELEKHVDSGNMAVAFGVFPVDINDLMAISEADRLMPPKSTWFEPKLASGMVVRTIDEGCVPEF
eukprot:TRINITY_DN32436_c0_g1_i1.p2 TRINITY_DN32436_c0_g1~~TRINITY_DN32436_c0_g1_i1.p2  ORF type:complete len:436 (+),score=184.85 TRINITY_DN32436_c0_g1_i1:128-1309(+)